MWGRARFAKMRGALALIFKRKAKSAPHGPAQITARKSKRTGKPILTEAALLQRGMQIHNRDRKMARVYANRHMKAPKGVCSDAAN